MFYDLINSLNKMENTENDLKSFKEHLETQLANKESDLYQAINGVQYTYDADLLANSPYLVLFGGIGTVVVIFLRKRKKQVKKAPRKNEKSE